MSDEEIKFKCEECGKEFDPEPDSMVELHLKGECPCCVDGVSEEELEEMIESGEAITAEKLSTMTEYELSEVGLTVDQRDALLRGEEMTIGAACICQECQDRMAE